MTKQWYCPRCDSGAVTHDDKIPMHRCKELRNILTPLVVVGEKVKIEVVEREDYIGSEKVQLDESGRPVMSVVTTRDDGQDCTIFAPVAEVGVEAE